MRSCCKEHSDLLRPSILALFLLGGEIAGAGCPDPFPIGLGGLLVLYRRAANNWHSQS